MKWLDFSPLLSHAPPLPSTPTHNPWPIHEEVSHMLPGIKSGCCPCLALAGAEVAVCDCAPSNCQSLCQKCHRTCCSLLPALCYSFCQIRAANLPQTAAHSTAPLLPATAQPFPQCDDITILPSITTCSLL